VLEPEAVSAALLAAAGEVQALMNHLGLAARSAPTAKFVFEADLRASLRRALQFGRSELVSVETSLGKGGSLGQPSDVVVAARAKVPQLAVELQFHPRGEDHAGFATGVIGDIVKMAVAKSRDAVEQATVLIAAPSRFWRWLPGFAEERLGYELLNPEADTPASVKSDFLAGSTWDAMFEAGMDSNVPDRLWTSSLGSVEAKSPWTEIELHLLEVKGLGAARDVRAE
jgi:hypothetical protein